MNFSVLVNALKNRVKYNREKTRLTNLISKQNEFCQRPLTDMLDFWDNLKNRLVMEFKSNNHNVSRSRLTKVTLASTKAGREKNVSLLDAAYCDIVNSARFVAKRQSRMNGMRPIGCGPSPLVFDKRNELRQIARANQFLRETNKIKDV